MLLFDIYGNKSQRLFYGLKKFDSKLVSFGRYTNRERGH